MSGDYRVVQRWVVERVDEIGIRRVMRVCRWREDAETAAADHPGSVVVQLFQLERRAWEQVWRSLALFPTQEEACAALQAEVRIESTEEEITDDIPGPAGDGEIKEPRE